MREYLGKSDILPKFYDFAYEHLASKLVLINGKVGAKQADGTVITAEQAMKDEFESAIFAPLRKNVSLNRITLQMPPSKIGKNEMRESEQVARNPQASLRYGSRDTRLVSLGAQSLSRLSSIGDETIVGPDAHFIEIVPHRYFEHDATPVDRLDRRDDLD